jgi:hypothetical protein
MTFNAMLNLKFFTRTRTRPINYANIFCLWHVYRAIGEDVPPGGYEDEEDGPLTTRHRVIKSSYITEPMSTQQLKKVEIPK